MLSFYCKIGNVNRIEKVTTVEQQSSYKNLEMFMEVRHPCQLIYMLVF